MNKNKNQKSGSTRADKRVKESTEHKYSGRQTKAILDREGSTYQPTRKDGRKADGFGCTDSNDPHWYYNNEQLLKDTASIPFSTPLGLGLSIWSTDNNALFQQYQVPGIMAITLQTTLGSPESPVDAYNVARRNIYSYVRHANSGSANYDAPNLMMYLTAMGACYSALSWATRIYGVISFYNQKNRYVPKAIIESMGVDYESVRQHLADFRAGVNNYAVRLSSMATPKDMPYFKREAWKYSGVYTDGSDLKSQLYLFRPFGFYRYVEPNTGAHEKVGSLVVDRIDYTQKMSYEDVLNVLNTLLIPILSSEDFGIMSGDILKAFGADNIVKLSTIDESYSVIPLKDMYVLHQIHNMITLGDDLLPADNVTAYFPTAFGGIKEDTSETASAGSLICDSKYYSYLPKLVNNSILDTDIANPLPADVMEMTRLVQYSSSETSADGVSYTNYIGYTGVDVAMYATIFTYSTDGKFTLTEKIFGTICSEPVQGLEEFDWHPIVYRVKVTKDSQGHNVVTGVDVNADLENYTILHKQTLTAMNEVAALSLFDVPSIGTWKLG